MGVTNWMIDLFSATIALGAGIGALRYRTLQSRYYPFLYLLWVGTFNEMLSFVLAQQGAYTIVNNNLYVLVEAWLITWLFQRQGLFLRQRFWFPLLCFGLTAVWLFESFVLRTLHDLCLYFRILYSFAIVLMSITTINRLLLTERGPVLRHALFLICVGFITYFTLKVLVNAFWLYGLTTSQEFLRQISRILIYINLFTNLLFAVAVLWIPRKQPSILPY